MLDVMLACLLACLLLVGSRDSAVALSSSLDIVTVNAWSRPIVIEASSLLILAMVVDVFKVEGMNMTREVAENGQTDVDEKVCTAS